MSPRPSSAVVPLNPSAVRAIVFDVDGTLYGQRGLRRAMLLRLLGEVARRPLSGLATLRALRAYRRAQELLREEAVDGGLAAAQLRLACEHSGQTEDVLGPLVARWMEREPLELLGRFVEPALRPLLTAVRARGIRLGVFSDYPAAAKLEAMGLTSFFDAVVCAQDSTVNRFKPHPAGLFEALRQLDARPAEALYVGDREEVDGTAARAAGVSCVIVGRRRPTSTADYHAVSNYGELHALLFPSANGEN